MNDGIFHTFCNLWKSLSKSLSKFMMFFWFSQTSWQTNVKNPSYFLSIYFNSHYMFRRTGPGHMLLHTTQNKRKQGRISLSLVKVKVNSMTNRCSCLCLRREKIEPLRGNPDPPQSVPLLPRPRGPSLPSPRTPPWPFPPKSAAQGWLRFDPLQCIAMVAAWLPHGSLLWWSRPGSRTPPPWW